MPKKATVPQETVSTVQARGSFSDLINRVAYGKRRIVLTRRSRALAAVVPIEDVERLEELEDREDLKLLRSARKEATRKGTIPWERIKKKSGLR